MTILDGVLIVIAIALVICPPGYDPAILWKERNEKRKENQK